MDRRSWQVTVHGAAKSWTAKHLGIMWTPRTDTDGSAVFWLYDSRQRFTLPKPWFSHLQNGLSTAALEFCCKDWEDYTRSFLLMHSEGNLAHCNHLINVKLLLKSPLFYVWHHSKRAWSWSLLSTPKIQDCFHALDGQREL